MIDAALLPVWSFRVNWAGKVLERLEFLTDVLQSETASEQRRQLRLSPRRSFEFDVSLLNSRDRQRFDSYMMTLAGGDWLVPVYPDGIALTNLAAAGSSVLDLPVAGREFTVGEYALILGKDSFTSERVLIDSIDADSLTLAAPTGLNWKAGAKVYPLKRGQLQELPNAINKTDRYAVATCRFNLQTANDWAGESTLPDYLGYPVLGQHPNHAEDMDFIYSRLLTELDTQQGLPYRVDNAGRTFTAQQYTWLLHGRAQHAAFRSAMYALAGRQKPCWMPTFNEDLIPTALTFSGGSRTALTVRSRGYHEVVGNNFDLIPGREHLQVELTDGTVEYWGLTPYQDGFGNVSTSGHELFYVDHWVGFTDVNRIKRMSFMGLGRLDQDLIEISHETDQDGTATAQAMFKTTKASTPIPTEPKLQTTMNSNSDGGFMVLMELKSTLVDFPWLLQNFKFITDAGPDAVTPEDHISINLGTDQARTLAVAIIGAKDSVTHNGPTLTPEGWTVMGHSAARDEVIAYRFSDTFGEDVEITATFDGAARASKAAALALFNECDLVQYVVADVAVQIAATLPAAPQPGNWLVCLSFFNRSCSVIMPGTAEPLWHNWYCYSNLFALEGFGIFYRQVPL